MKGNEKIVKADFPKTFADLSFTERIDNAKEGYEPFKNASPYQKMTIEKEEDYLARLKKTNLAAYCKRNLNDTACCTLYPDRPMCKNFAQNNNNNNSYGNNSGGDTTQDGIIHLVLK